MIIAVGFSQLQAGILLLGALAQRKYSVYQAGFPTGAAHFFICSLKIFRLLNNH